MGIRYYAYAFDADLTERALAYPRSVIGETALAGAWGMPHGAAIEAADLPQPVPEDDMLCLDRAWSGLQALTAPRSPGQPPRPAHRMLEGRVSLRGMCWDPWTRAVLPGEVPEIADDLLALRQELEEGLSQHPEGEQLGQYLDRAVDFASRIARSGRGFVYLIG
ncbi:DUF1877 domain-containing protein [Rathayibacter festucae]|uniref:DUF1877 domain-containing protein n=1 Tax=Rathayibacter festucae TaxID=110937 RepID=A0ABX6H104_9MICO|nr:DUF1877 domain-containing protein [Rathayibacter festucae]QHC63473.1 DUF1877 domain-containing protein [Rathayibacter festucae]